MSLKYFSIVLLLSATLPVATATAAAVGPTGAVRASPLDGRWTATITRAQLRRAGASAALAGKLYGSYTARHENGRFEIRNHRTGGVARGTFTVRGDVFRGVFARGVGVKPGDVMVCTWSVYRDRLTFRPIPGRPSQLCDAAVWTRAR